MLKEILITLLAFSGIFVGTMLSFISPEELKPGKNYFRALRILLFLFIIGLSFYFLKDFWVRCFLMLLLGYGIFGFYKNVHLIELYSPLGIVLFLTMKEEYAFLSLASLIFFYGVAESTLLRANKIKLRKKDFLKRTMLYYSWFLVLVFISVAIEFLV
ncbi:hypothetical protein ACFL0W_04690 [Nanoarchaeota archaeon]